MKTTFKDFTITSEYIGDKEANFIKGNYNNHSVTIRNRKNGKQTSFEFWASIMNPELQSDYDLRNAFYCFVSDAISGNDSFEDFCGNLGYDSDSRNAERIHNACKQSLKKLQRIYSGDIYDLCNELSEVAA